MKYVAIAAALLALPHAALAQQATGTINLTGSVAGRCSVVGGGQAFSETINLGELSGGDGRLRTGPYRRVARRDPQLQPGLHQRDAQSEALGHAPVDGDHGADGLRQQYRLHRASGGPASLGNAAPDHLHDCQFIAGADRRATDRPARQRGRQCDAPCLQLRHRRQGRCSSPATYTSVINITISPT